MNDNELLLIDRLGVIRDTINKYGEDNFYLSFSGGKDSTVVSLLLDMALPENRIPRVFINTGIEYQAIVDFVHSKMEKDDRFVEVKPSKPIKKTLEEVGYPFKSKEHSTKLGLWQRGSRSYSVTKYISNSDSKYGCPKALQYQFSDDFKLKVSEKCCYELKKAPASKWKQENGKKIIITGMRTEEGGQRARITCIVTRGGEVVRFHPLAVVPDGWEDWLLEREGERVCSLYYPPYNFKRTGCKGCPFSLDLQRQLETMEVYLPAERKQCEYIWKPVYEEYRRIGYRLKKTEQNKLF